MNNLTPLQEVASRIYAAKIASGAWNPTAWGATVSEFLYVSEPEVKDKMIQDSVSEAKALLEACKPEPLEWWEIPHPLEGFSSTWYTKGGEFKIIYNGAERYSLCDLAHSVTEDRVWFYANSVEEAKAFAEHIRTR